ncbi:MAG: amidohydrolase family protein, partial [Steroidobacteraceae bacterium]
SETLNKAGEYGPEIARINGKTQLKVGPYAAIIPDNFAEGMEQRNDPNWLAGELDKHGIDMLGVTASPLFYLYWAPERIALPFCELQNDCMAKFVKKRPDRFFWMSTLPMQNVDAAIAEAKRTAALGASGVNIGGEKLGGRNLDDKAFWPLYQTLVDLNLAIFIHPYPHPMAEGYEDRYNMSWITGYPGQETTAFAYLTLGGVFDDFPKLRVYITHGGGFVPYQFGRIEGAFKTKAPGLRAKKPIAEYLPNFYFDILTHDNRATKFLVDFVGADQLVIGSNYSGWNWSNEFVHLEELKLPQSDQEKIAYKNATRLFNLKVPA